MFWLRNKKIFWLLFHRMQNYADYNSFSDLLTVHLKMMGVSLNLKSLLFCRHTANVKPQIHIHDFGPRQSYDSSRLVKLGYIGMILSSNVALS